MSKDKAIAQRVDAQQRLQDLSVTKQMAALGVLDALSTTINTTSDSTVVVESIQVATTSANSEAQGQLSPPTPSMLSGSSRSSQTSSISKGSCGSSHAAKKSSSERHPAASACASSSPGGGGADSSLNTSCDEGAVALDNGNNRGWSCVSCSFLNVEAAKKCKICSTKNYQPPPLAGELRESCAQGEVV